jgi:hypothetical protein
MIGKRFETSSVVWATWFYLQDRRYLLPLDGKRYRNRHWMGQANKEGWYATKRNK